MENLHPIKNHLLTKENKERFLNQRSCAVWLTGLSGSGKSTIALGLEKMLRDKGFLVKVLDGDNVRTGICNNLGFSSEDRKENIRRIAEVSKLFVESGIITINSFISPSKEMRDMARTIIGATSFFEIYINASLDVCESRDVKRLYKKARSGEITNFTGISAPYEAPTQPALEINTQEESVEESVMDCYHFLINKINPQ